MHFNSEVGVERKRGRARRGGLAGEKAARAEGGEETKKQREEETALVKAEARAGLERHSTFALRSNKVEEGRWSFSLK